MCMLKGSDLSQETLKVIAPAKINLHLEVLGLRPDGFHELSMVMQSIDLQDQLDIIKVILKECLLIFPVLETVIMKKKLKILYQKRGLH